VIGVVVFLALVVFAGFQLNQARVQFIARIDGLESELSEAETRIEELQSQLNDERTARTQAEATAKDAGAAADQARAEARSRQEELNATIQTLEASVQDYEQRIAAADEAKAKAETELSREIELRKTAEKEIADVRDQLQQQMAPGSAASVPTAPVASAPPSTGARTDAQSRASTTSAGKQSFATSEAPARASEAFDTPPKPLDLVSPEYPPTLKQQGTEGNVVVAFTVDTRGRVQDVEVREATNAEFETAAVAAVRKWRFKPALRAGEPVAVRISQRLDFTDN
jgi:protein TonB